MLFRQTPKIKFRTVRLFLLLLALARIGWSQSKLDTVLAGTILSNVQLVQPGTELFLQYQIKNGKRLNFLFIEKRKLLTKSNLIVSQKYFKNDTVYSDSIIVQRNTLIPEELYSSLSSKRENIKFHKNYIKGYRTYVKQNGRDSTVTLSIKLEAPVFSVGISDEIFQALNWNTHKIVRFFGDEIFYSKFQYLGTEALQIADGEMIDTILFLWNNTKIWLDSKTQTVVKKRTAMPDGSTYIKLRLFED